VRVFAIRQYRSLQADMLYPLDLHS